MMRTSMAITALGLLTTKTASAAEIPSVFFVSETINKNQVHYAVRVDDACAVTGPDAIRPYWRMLERGPTATEPISAREQKYFGVEGARADGNQITFSVHALPSRVFTIRTWKNADGSCGAVALTPIQRVFARLYNVHAVIRWFHLDHLLFTGWNDDGSVLRERVEL